MIDSINRNYYALKYYKKNLEKAAYRTLLFIQDDNSLIYAKTKFGDMYDNYIRN